MKNVSINKWEKMIDKHEKSAIAKIHKKSAPEEEGLEVEIKIGLTNVERMSFVKGIVMGSFDENDGQFLPYGWTLTWNLFLIDYFTNITISKDYDKMMTFIRDTDIIEVINSFNFKLVHDLMAEVEDLIDYEKSVRANGFEIKRLCDLLIGIIDGISGSVADINKEIAEKGLEDLIGGTTQESLPSNVVPLDHGDTNVNGK